MSVSAGGPKRRNSKRRKLDWSALIDAAEASPGEWFNTPLPDDLTSHNVSGSLSFAFFKRHCEMAVRDKIVYLRFRTADE